MTSEQPIKHRMIHTHMMTYSVFCSLCPFAFLSVGQTETVCAHSWSLEEESGHYRVKHLICPVSIHTSAFPAPHVVISILTHCAKIVNMG